MFMGLICIRVRDHRLTSSRVYCGSLALALEGKEELLCRGLALTQGSSLWVSKAHLHRRWKAETDPTIWVLLRFQCIQLRHYS